MIEPEQQRKTPAKKVQEELLQKQDGRCLYCSRMFGTYVPDLKNPVHLVRLKIHWDHMVPYSYQQNNSGTNFAACCHQCNLLKGALVFPSIEEASVYLTAEIKAKTKPGMPGVP